MSWHRYALQEHGQPPRLRPEGCAKAHEYQIENREAFVASKDFKPSAGSEGGYPMRYA